MSHDTLTIESEKQEPALLQKHAKFFVRFLNLLPARLASHDSTRGTIAFFAVCGLDVLNSLPLLTPQIQKDIIEWIYGGLVTSIEGETQASGFQGTRCVNILSNDEQLLANVKYFQWGHLAMTYTAIGILATLGDDLSRLDRKSIVDGVAAVQRPDGSFSACIDGSENDMRFVFCAAAICHMLDYWGDINKEKMYEFIMKSLRYDNGFSQYLEGEAHGGTTFCALAALDLSGQLAHLDETTKENILRWLIFRQVNGFQGRPNKTVDTCYSFWIGAALRILDAFEYIDYDANRAYIMETQDSIVGGFSKWPQSTTDPFHTYFGLCGLAFMQEPGLMEVMPSLNISMRAYKRLKQLHYQWQNGATDDRFVNKDTSNKVSTSIGKLNSNGGLTTNVTSPLIMQAQ
ncbi:geranylgeranyl transferase type-1 subunit beta isoform X2 [Eurosta solidaginis]|uniref:geranylgeranyl transferase type-1 subunit beta isoform X2 n=1 Tax=Eurosta solidaginis TaxID=178769 RepID=UPI00353096F1